MSNIEKLNQFLESLEKKAIDFYPVSENFSRPNIDHLDKAKFKALGRTAADCIILAWKNNGQEYWEDCPIAWLDSEGEPNAIFANNSNEFISLLYFDTYRIYETLMDILRKGDNFQLAEPDSFKIDIDYAKSTYPAYSELTDFIQKNLHIQPAAQPEKLILEAYSKFKDFRANGKH